MHYDDLTNYSYELEKPLARIRNVGWLSKDHSFPVGKLGADFLRKIRELTSMDNYAFNETKGFHFCDFCQTKGMTAKDLFRLVPASSSEIMIPDITNIGHHFSSPRLIDHYISSHGYLPPEAFVQSIVATDIDRNFDAKSIFDSIYKESAPGTYDTK